jgi:hypothetical protein
MISSLPVLSHMLTYIHPCLPVARSYLQRLPFSPLRVKPGAPAGDAVVEEEGEVEGMLPAAGEAVGSVLASSTSVSPRQTKQPVVPPLPLDTKRTGSVLMQVRRGGTGA